MSVNLKSAGKLIHVFPEPDLEGFIVQYSEKLPGKHDRRILEECFCEKPHEAYDYGTTLRQQNAGAALWFNPKGGRLFG